MLSDCTLCPRDCHVNRSIGERGVCGQSEDLYVARAALHFWEEPCISGDRGSGTVFFSGCALGCIYCQNRSIASCEVGKKISAERLSDIFIELQNKGAHNINLVTPDHYVPQIIKALEGAKKKGLIIPVVYNCSGYEKVETLRLLEGFIDIYLPDFKYMSHELSELYSNAKDYSKVAKEAVCEMVRQCKGMIFDDNGILQKGVIVRHLLLPGYLSDSKSIVKYLYETYGDSIYLSLMNQYTPLDSVKSYPEINRKVTNEEYEKLIDYAISLGVENAFIQEGETAGESFIPLFDYEGV